MTQILTPSLVYSFREIPLLALPKTVQDVIASLQLGPVQQGFVKKTKFQKPHASRFENRRPSHSSGGAAPNARADVSANWREAAAAHARHRVTEVDDVDYAETFALLNKLSKMNYEKLSTLIMAVLKKREDDGVFRLRIVTLIFSKGTQNAMFAPLFNKMFVDMNNIYPEVLEDLKTVCNIDSWKAMYAEEVIVLPGASDPNFDEIAIRWTRQKERRRGYSRFMIELYLFKMIEGEVVESAIQTILDDLKESIASPKTMTTEEYVNQLSTFVFDTSRMLKGKPLADTIKVSTREIVQNAATYSCLPMRAKFKLEDSFKML